MRREYGSTGVRQPQARRSPRRRSATTRRSGTNSTSLISCAEKAAGRTVLTFVLRDLTNSSTYTLFNFATQRQTARNCKSVDVGKWGENTGRITRCRETPSDRAEDRFQLVISDWRCTKRRRFRGRRRRGQSRGASPAVVLAVDDSVVPNLLARMLKSFTLTMPS